MPLPPLSLYVHFPWCIAKCPYCDFNSHTLRGELPADEYISALVREVHELAGEHRDRPLTSIFFGGGTPSVFAPEFFARLLTEISHELTLTENIEITLEANPGTIEHGSFSGYLDVGINRLSLGVQSFSDDKLKALGRIHDAEAARSAYLQAREAGFQNINLDLMYGLPEQSETEALDDIQAAITLAPEHISFYQLTLEPNTVFYARPPVLPDSDSCFTIQSNCAQELEHAGYKNYEVSAWAQPGKQCLHNLNYWRYGDYLGLGAGAHAKLSQQDGQVTRTSRVAHPREYLQRVQTGNAIAKQFTIGRKDLVFEYMLNNLRLRDGFELAHFSAATQLPPDTLIAALREAEARELLAEPAPGHWRPTDQGWRFLNDLQAIFLP